MTIDPRWSIGLALAIALLGYISGIGGLLTDAGMSPAQVKVTLAIVSITMGFLSTINAVLTGIPSKDNQKGFIVKGPLTDDNPRK